MPQLVYLKILNHLRDTLKNVILTQTEHLKLLLCSGSYEIIEIVRNLQSVCNEKN
jgi:hypothetical protein